MQEVHQLTQYYFPFLFVANGTPLNGNW